jgi:hypothetical protein
VSFPGSRCGGRGVRGDVVADEGLELGLASINRKGSFGVRLMSVSDRMEVESSRLGCTARR